MSLGVHSSCQCDSCHPDWGSPVGGFKRIPELFTIFNEQFCPPDGLLLTFRGQFVVSRDRIRQISKDKYRWLRETLVNMSHFIHDDYPSDIWFDAPKAPDNPLFGHTVERSWLFIFGCNDMAIARDCESLDKHPETARCACYDT